MVCGNVLVCGAINECILLEMFLPKITYQLIV